MTNIKSSAFSDNPVHSLAADATDFSSHEEALSFGKLLLSRSPATAEDAAPTESAVIVKSTVEDPLSEEPSNHEGITLEQLTDLIKSGPQQLPLPLMTEIAASMHRQLAEPMNLESGSADLHVSSKREASRMREEESILAMLSWLGKGETSRLPQITSQLREAIREGTFKIPFASGYPEIEGNLFTTGKGISPLPPFALMGEESGQTSSTLSRPATAMSPAQIEPSAQAISEQVQMDLTAPRLETAEGVLSAITAKEVVGIKAGQNPHPTSESPVSGIILHTPSRPESLSPTPASVVSELALHINQKNWSQLVGQQLVWMAQNHAQQAEIKVNPAHLGPIEVHLSLHQDQANINFFAHEAMVRDVLEKALPTLREMFSNHGLQLNQANISDQSLTQQQQQSNGRSANQGDGWRENEGMAELDPEDEQVLSIENRRGRVDHYI